MRRVMTVLSVVAVAVLAASAVQADSRTAYYMANYQAGLAYFPFENTENGNFAYLSPFDSPTATSQGALWLKTSATATPAWLDQDVNLQLNFKLQLGLGVDHDHDGYGQSCVGRYDISRLFPSWRR